jgi:hypothetical protein
MECITFPTATYPNAGVVLRPRTSMPSVLRNRAAASWRLVPSIGGAVFAGTTHSATAAVSAKRADRGAVAKQASPPRGSRLTG